MNLDPENYSILTKPIDSVKAFLTETLPQLGWGKSGAEEVVLDIGCGPGGNTVKLVLPLFPHLKRIFAFDLLPNMIEFAKTNNSHSKVEYSVGNIERMVRLEKWKGQITKIVSVHCFQWLKDKKKGFYSVHQLLKTGGEAAICLGVDDYVSDGYLYKHDCLHYKKMLEEIGFHVRLCTEERKLDPFSSDDEYRNFFASICVFMSYVPDDLKEEFKDDLFEEMMKENGRNGDGLPLHWANTIELPGYLIIMFFDAVLYNTMDKPWKTILEFLNETLPKFGWNSDGPEVVMDLGSGPGYLSKNYILPSFPNLKKLIAADASACMIEEAKIQHPHPKIEYVVADIEDRSTIEPWLGQVTKLISVHCFNWLKDQKKGFQAVYDLLKPGGEAAFIFTLQSPYYDGLILTGKNPKFSSYFKGADFCIPESYRDNYDASNYRKMFQDIGFKIIHCIDEMKEDVLPCDQEYKDIFYSVCPLKKYLPDDLKEEFKEVLFQNTMKHAQRTKEGLPIHKSRTVEIFIKKEK
ncbi:juvenile hormone acid O-methyltransferase [Caerostris extrusa]|uniref:Juvenile hormone acid O-methyltransferase n=1 Tax=Caerostris extrusa TaxID=172846 RepID=A0AAV4TK53_CAEEX|nr:juvenile hormone acid O-methyltransferase [Caerostris extrusa]